jgi:hypothetical protein
MSEDRLFIGAAVTQYLRDDQADRLSRLAGTGAWVQVVFQNLPSGDPRGGVVPSLVLSCRVGYFHRSPIVVTTHGGVEHAVHILEADLEELARTGTIVTERRVQESGARLGERDLRSEDQE